MSLIAEPAGNPAALDKKKDANCVSYAADYVDNGNIDHFFFTLKKPDRNKVLPITVPKDKA